MDPLSQGALGAALAASAPARRQARERVVPAVFLGATAGMAPDLDVLIRSSGDPLLFLEYHRQFTHSLAFAPIGALVSAVLLHGLVRRRLRFSETYLFCLLGFASHGLLDACTSYGTALLWPFSELRVAWNVISVIDPLFTVPLLALLVWGFIRKSSVPPRLGLCWVLVYLGLGTVQGWRAEQAGVALAEARGHAPERFLVKPSFGNLLVWKVIYLAEDVFHVDAVRVGLNTTYFPGTAITELDVAGTLPWLSPESRQARDLERFRRFSEGYLAPAPGRDNAIIDMRYSLIPNDVDPLWGILLDPLRQHEHAEFFTDRAINAADRRTFIRMLVEPGLSLDAVARSDVRFQACAQPQSSWSQPSPSRQPSLQ